MTCLLVDMGNTQVKCVWDRDGEFKAWPVVRTDSADLIDALNNAADLELTPKHVFASNVAGPDIAATFDRFVRNRWGLAVHYARVKNPCAGMRTAYRDPSRLGVDRWLAALAAWHSHQSAVCVIDVGTALTADIVTAEGEHLGGLIAPGLELMRESLTHSTAHLESDNIRIVAGFADNTADAISLGCTSAVAGLLGEVRKRLQASKAVQDCQWFVTGGGAAVVETLMDWPHETDPLLVQRGLKIAMSETA